MHEIVFGAFVGIVAYVIGALLGLSPEGALLVACIAAVLAGWLCP